MECPVLFFFHCREERAIELYKQLKMKCKSKEGRGALQVDRSRLDALMTLNICLHQRLKPT